MNKKIIIVGGVAGGASAAARIRRLDENAQIIMFEKGEYISFANCGLPYYIGETITEREKLLVQTVEGMSAKFNLDIRNLSEVIKIDKKNKIITVKNHKTGEIYEESYDVLILSPGAKPVKPNLKGINECENLFTLRNVPDTDNIKTYVDNNNPKNAVVIGGGFIGLEMAENLYDRGINITLVQSGDQVMQPLDIEMASIIHEHLIDKGVELLLGDTVEGFGDKGSKVILKSGKVIEADIIILSIGVRPETTIAKDANLKLNDKGAIVVNSKMQTSDSNIYAIGDAIEVVDFVNKNKTMIPLAWPANRQGRLVADIICGIDTEYKGTLGSSVAIEVVDFVNKNKTMIPLAWPANRQGRLVADIICGIDTEYKGTLGSSVAKIFDYTVATTGNNEKTLKSLGLDYDAIHIHPNSSAGYYPGSFPIYLKMLFNKETGKIYGAQGVGIEGVEKRIDVLATAIKAGLTIFDLPDIEVCYAPPYNSAKDPVNMLGYYASNIAEGKVKTIQWNEVNDIDLNKGIILDVRDDFELVTGGIENSVNIPLGQLRERINELPKDKTIYTTCQVGIRGYIASRILEQNGFDSYNIDGGVKTYLSVKRAKNTVKKQDQKLGKEIYLMRNNSENTSTNITLDACGLQCPGPIKRVYEEISKMNDGDTLEVKASDPGFAKDIKSWCESTNNTLINAEFDKNKKAVVALIKKGNENQNENKDITINEEKNGATLVVFSGDLDKAIASFIIATGAASMGKQVTMFFTFWGLSILKKEEKVNVQKDTMEKMFDMMLPSHAGKLPLSQMNMGGMGPKMIKQIMKKNNVDDLQTLIKNAIDMGVKVVACSMSMDLMGIKKEEFIDGVELGGVASYLGATDNSNLNLFI